MFLIILSLSPSLLLTVEERFHILEKNLTMISSNDLYSKQQKTREMFNRIARTYDTLNRGLSLGVDVRWRKQAIDNMDIREDSIILDVATGTGDLAILALRKNASMVYGVDPASQMIRKTNEKLMAYSGKFKAVEAFGEYLPFKSSYFSHVMISYGIRNVSDRKKAISEFHRVLKKGGMCTVLEFSKTGVPFFHSIYNLYFHHVLTRIGGWISGDREAYEYLPKSVSQFPSKEVFIEECLESGFKLKSVKNIFFGISTMYLFEK